MTTRPLSALRESHAELLELAKLFEQTIEYEIRRSKDEGDDEGVRLKTFPLISARSAIVKAEQLRRGVQ